jgi:hypothetical protein
MYYEAALGIIVGLVLILFAPSIRRKEERKRKARLAELANGASEYYFEERRELEAYPIRRPPTIRLLGIVLVIAGTAVLFL